MNSEKYNEQFGIPENILSTIVLTICKNKKITKIILFGSRVKGDFKKGSDIDISLLSEKLDYNELMKIKVDVGELMIPYTVDIVDFYNIKSEDLKEHILRVGKVIYSS